MPPIATASGFNGHDVLEDHEAETTRLAGVLVHHDLHKPPDLAFGAML